MRCNPSRWLWGLIPVAVWSWVTVLGEHGRIEADLRQRAEGALAGSGLAWAKSSFDGRDGQLSGRALDEGEPGKAAEIARRVWGVRLIDNRADLLEKVENYVWSAALADGVVKLGGYVPNEALRKQVLAAVGANLASLKIDDGMKLARGAPPKDAWLGGIGYGLKQLAALKRGVVELNGASLSVAGEARDFPSYKGVKKSLQNLPQGVKLVSDRVTAPVVVPYTWSAKLAASQLVLSGYVPSEKLREDIFAQVKKGFPRIAIVDRMEIADGAPEGWANIAVAGLGGLGKLQEGTVEIAAREVTLSGKAEDEATAELARSLFKKDAPKAFKLADNIKFVKPTLPVASPFVTRIEAKGSVVELSGSVPTDAGRAAILEAVKARLPGRTVNDKMQLAAGAPAGWQTCLAAGVSGIGRLGAGSVQLTDGRAEVVGEADDEALAQAVTGEVRAAASRACEADVKVALRAAQEPNLTWRAARSIDNELLLEGDVPDAATRSDLLASAARHFAGAKITDRMTVANAKSQIWGGVADLGLKSLARLRRGEVVLSRQDLLVRGEAADTAVAATLKEQIARDVGKGYTGRDAIEVRTDAAIWAEAEAKKKAEAERIALDAEAARKAGEAKRQADAAALSEKQAANTAVDNKRKADALRCQTLIRSAAAEGIIQFERAKADIDRKSFPTLDQLTRLANDCPEFKISIEGHTDAEGTDERNQKLSDRRAKAVADYLAKAGVQPDRLTSAGYGAARPIAPNDTAENRAKNRRIEFEVKAN